MEAAMKECRKPHALAHSVAGAGLAFVVLALVPSLATSALLIGVVLVVAGIGWDLMVNKPGRK